MPARSWLFVPADSEKKLGKVAATGADVVILDLEDAVAPENKPRARTLAHDWLVAHRTQVLSGVKQMHWVRINALDTQWWREDLEAVMPAAPVGIVLPKSAGPDSIAQLSAEIYELENRHGLPNNSTKILALVSETARAAATIPAYVGASMPRLAGLTWGAEDLSAAIGASRKRTETGGWSDTFRFVRSQTLLTAHAQGVLAIDTLHSDFRDNAGLEKIAADARADGFDGMLAIHPAQVPIINKAFAPTEAEIARARSIVALFEANPGAGALQLDGDMIDQPHLVQARKLLDEVKDDPPRRVV